MAVLGDGPSTGWIGAERRHAAGLATASAGPSDTLVLDFGVRVATSDGAQAVRRLCRVAVSPRTAQQLRNALADLLARENPR